MINTSFLTRLLETSNVTTNEGEVGRLVYEELSEKCSIKITKDSYGNECFSSFQEDEYKILLEAHGDEIGFQITYIDDNGFIYIRRSGGIDNLTVPGSHVVISGYNNQKLYGVIGKKPIHVTSSSNRNDAIKLEDLFIDTGLPVDKVKEKVRVGNYVSYLPNVTYLGEDKIVSKGLDNKIGVYIITEARKRLMSLKGDCVVGVSVQEEVGKGGCLISKLVDPNVIICVDVCATTDTPSISKTEYGDISLGDGVVITIHGDSCNDLIEIAEKLAKENKINCQIGVGLSVVGCTSAFGFSKTGIPTLLLSVPNRYMHTQVEMCDLNDVESTIQLIVEIVKYLDQELFNFNI